tara:strand:+ start:58 stop:1311 length:1254 start_codon:yes stop_codon:yes gene_type:complete
MKEKRVVVTGIGALTPIGNNLTDYWNNLLMGKSGAGPITLFDASEYKTKFACEVKNFDPTNFIHRKDARKMDRFCQFAMAVSEEAISDSKLISNNTNLDRIGVIWGSGIGGLGTFYNEAKSVSKDKTRPRFNPFFIPKIIADIPAGHISIKYGFKGPNYTTVSACASSTHALIDAFNYIKWGKADAFLVGGSEAAVNEPGIGGFNAMMALSTNNEKPKEASKPFDRDRDGFVLGEGAGAFVVEELSSAINRGAKIYAEIIGGGATGDAHHITAPHPQGEGAKRVMKMAIEDGMIQPNQIDYINVHGTSTPLGDVAELQAIQDLFKEHAYKLNISSTKSMTGHLLGAAGIVEAIACVMATKTNIVPPTINQFNRDDNIDKKLNLTENIKQERNINYSLSNTFGFGGHNASVLFKKYPA